MTNPMQTIRLSKVTLNFGAGEAGTKLENGKKILDRVSGKAAVITKTHKRTTFGVAKHRPIGAMVTIRGKKATTILATLLEAVEKKLKAGSFDTQGNISFGIHEYINIPGIKYDPEIGIVGFEVAVTLERPGYRVSRRRIRPGKIGKQHRITPAAAQEYMKQTFGVTIV